MYAYLRVSEAQRGRELTPVRLCDVLLQLETLLQPLALEVGEHGPGPRPLSLSTASASAASRG